MNFNLEAMDNAEGFLLRDKDAMAEEEREKKYAGNKEYGPGLSFS